MCLIYLIRMEQNINWEEIKRLYPVGKILPARVTRHYPFGIMLDIGHPIVIGHIPGPDFVVDPHIYLPYHTVLPFPDIVSQVKCKVIDYTFDERNQVWFTIKM